ncbi:hypothetical protein [Fodinibius halophilus]|uniref:Universal stress protein n=1 Tax=Fodinibius halophilus TaxID=1736908 RepID=A0A6M1TBI6_9BACT|nr:hypothetical protein [Fodinibius halophilus]NGP89391.1 hypothetical protein [Fodinibius halophilus]
MPVSLPITILIVDTEEQDIDVEGIQLLSKEQLEMAGLKTRQIHTKKVEIPKIVKVVTQIAGEKDLLVLVESVSQKKQAFIKSSTAKIKGTVTCPTLVVLPEEKESSD